MKKMMAMLLASMMVAGTFEKNIIRRKIMKKEYWALLVFVLIIVLQWIGLGFYGQIRFIFLIIILVLIVLFAILLRK